MQTRWFLHLRGARYALHRELDDMQTRWFLHLRGARQQQTRRLPHFSGLRFSKLAVCNTFGLVLGLKTVATCRFVESGARKLLKMTGLWVGFRLDVGNVAEVSLRSDPHDDSDNQLRFRARDVGNVSEVSLRSDPHDESDNCQEKRMLDVGNVREVSPRPNLQVDFDDQLRFRARDVGSVSEVSVPPNLCDESDTRSRSCATYASIARDSRGFAHGRQGRSGGS